MCAPWWPYAARMTDGHDHDADARSLLQVAVAVALLGILMAALVAVSISWFVMGFSTAHD